MYNLQRVIKTQDTKNIPVQNKYNSPDGWEMEYLTFPGLTKTVSGICSQHGQAGQAAGSLKA